MVVVVASAVVSIVLARTLQAAATVEVSLVALLEQGDTVRGPHDKRSVGEGQLLYSF